MRDGDAPGAHPALWSLGAPSLSALQAFATPQRPTTQPSRTRPTRHDGGGCCNAARAFARRRRTRFFCHPELVEGPSRSVTLSLSKGPRRRSCLTVNVDREAPCATRALRQAQGDRGGARGANSTVCNFIFSAIAKETIVPRHYANAHLAEGGCAMMLRRGVAESRRPGGPGATEHRATRAQDARRERPRRSTIAHPTRHDATRLQPQEPECR